MKAMIHHTEQIGKRVIKTIKSRQGILGEEAILMSLELALDFLPPPRPLMLRDIKDLT
jgi:hypothetical protein